MNLPGIGSIAGSLSGAPSAASAATGPTSIGGFTFSPKAGLSGWNLALTAAGAALAIALLRK